MSDKPCILVGVDASELGAEAVRQADAWARTHGWRLLVCHVAPAPLGAPMLFPQRTEQRAIAQPEIERRLAETLSEHVAALTGRDPAEAEAEVLVATGAPDAELVRAAEARSPRLLVIGSHSHSALRHIFLGDVAERVVRHAPCSVLVARPHRTTKQILATTDFSDDAGAAVAFAAEHARAVGARLTIACSIEKELKLVAGMTSFGAAYGFVEHEDEELRRAAARRLGDELASLGADGDTRVLEGKPAAAILEAAAELDADLVVLGARGRSGLRRLLLGSVAEKVVRAAPCSVVVARVAPAVSGR